ncbi:Cytosolic Fe-S cluster assembly factor CFD1-like, partial [Homarus americanus]
GGILPYFAAESYRLLGQNPTVFWGRILPSSGAESYRLLAQNPTVFWGRILPYSGADSYLILGGILPYSGVDSYLILGGILPYSGIESYHLLWRNPTVFWGEILPSGTESSPHGNIKTLSVGSLLSSGAQAIVWRGPRKTALIRRMIKDTLWGRLDDLIIDTPPGTSDEHLTVIKLLATTKPDGAVIVTSPQMLSA